MCNLEELESWYDDLRAWERFHDELEKINGENLNEILTAFQNRKLSLQQKASTQPCAEHRNHQSGLQLDFTS